MPHEAHTVFASAQPPQATFAVASQTAHRTRLRSRSPLRRYVPMLSTPSDQNAERFCSARNICATRQRTRSTRHDPLIRGLRKRTPANNPPLPARVDARIRSNQLYSTARALEDDFSTDAPTWARNGTSPRCGASTHLRRRLDRRDNGRLYCRALRPCGATLVEIVATRGFTQRSSRWYTARRAYSLRSGDGRTYDSLSEDGQARHNGYTHGACEIPLHVGVLQQLVLSVVRQFA
jgi:hypothetical protein